MSVAEVFDLLLAMLVTQIPRKLFSQNGIFSVQNFNEISRSNEVLFSVLY